MVSQIRLILDKLNPIRIYGYYSRGSGYEYIYNHEIVCAISPTKAHAIEQALCAAGMLFVSELDGDRGECNFLSAVSISHLQAPGFQGLQTLLLGYWLQYAKWVRQQLETGWVCPLELSLNTTPSFAVLSTFQSAESLQYD